MCRVLDGLDFYPIVGQILSILQQTTNSTASISNSFVAKVHLLVDYIP